MARQQPAGPPPLWGNEPQPAPRPAGRTQEPQRTQGRPAPSPNAPARSQGAVEEVEVGALTQVERATLDVQIVTAKAYPRHVGDCLTEARTLATLDQQTAGSMFYRLKREGKIITGPSARLAEILAYSWKNLRIEGEVIEMNRTHLVAMGTCFDLERNVARRTRVTRRITKSDGSRYSDDMIAVTASAATSIAARNAMIQSIPRVFVDQICAEAMQLYAGKVNDLPLQRSNAIEWFTKQGATQEQVLKFLGVERIEQIDKDGLASLRGLRNAIEEGHDTIENGLQGIEREAAEAAGGGADELNTALGQG